MEFGYWDAPSYYNSFLENSILNFYTLYFIWTKLSWLVNIFILFAARQSQHRADGRGYDFFNLHGIFYSLFGYFSRYSANQILDKATISLDAEFELQFNQVLRRRACTKILVAHRLSSIREPDQILVWYIWCPGGPVRTTAVTTERPLNHLCSTAVAWELQ